MGMVFYFLIFLKTNFANLLETVEMYPGGTSCRLVTEFNHSIDMQILKGDSSLLKNCISMEWSKYNPF